MDLFIDGIIVNESKLFNNKMKFLLLLKFKTS